MDTNEYSGESSQAFSPSVNTETDFDARNSVLPPLHQHIHHGQRHVERPHSAYPNHMEFHVQMDNSGLHQGVEQVGQAGAYLRTQQNTIRGRLGGRSVNTGGGAQFRCSMSGPMTTDEKLDRLERSMTNLISIWTRDTLEMKLLVQSVGGNMESRINSRLEQLEDRLTAVLEDDGAESHLFMYGETGEENYQIEDQQSQFSEHDDFVDSVSNVGMSAVSNTFGHQTSTRTGGAIFAPFLNDDTDNLTNVWTASAGNLDVNPIQPDILNELQPGNVEILDTRSGGNVYGEGDTDGALQNVVHGNTDSGERQKRLTFCLYGNQALSSTTIIRQNEPHSARMLMQATNPGPGTSSRTLFCRPNSSSIQEPRPDKKTTRSSRKANVNIKRERVVHFAVGDLRSANHTCNCGKRYESWPALLTHVKYHGTVNPRWKCPRSDCSQKFIYPFLVNRHLASVHKQVLQCLGRCFKCYKVFPEKMGMLSHLNQRGEVCKRSPKRTSVRPPPQNGAASTTPNAEPPITLD